MLFWICQEPPGPYWFLNIQELRGEAHLSRSWGIQAFLITVINTFFLIMSQMVKDDCLQLSLFDRDHLMFCKSGILIFIFAENYYSIYAHARLIKTPLLHQSFGPHVFLSFLLSIPSLFLSLYFWLISWSAEARWAHFLAQASKTLSRRRTVPSPTREGAWCLRAAAWALRTGFYWLSA